MKFSRFLATLVLLALSVLSFADSVDVKELVKMQGSFFENQGQKYIAISLKNKKKWHTYWKNPGDAGLPPSFTLIFDGETKKLDLAEWPAPKRYIEAGNIWAYGYSGTNTWFAPIESSFYNKLVGKEATLQGKWLVCKDICIPGEDEIQLNFSEQGIVSTPNYFKISARDIREAFDNLPKDMQRPEGVDFYLSQTSEDSGSQLAVYYSAPKGIVKSDLGKQNLFFPFPNKYFDFKHEEIFSDAEKYYGKMIVDWNGIYMEPEMALPSDGNFESPIPMKFLFKNPNSGNLDVLNFSLNSFTIDKSGTAKKFYESLTPFDSKKSGQVGATPSKGQEKSLLYFILFAFIGGFILNFMPCVLPVISLKLFSLIKHKDASRGKLFRHNLAYTAGVIFSFLILGSVIVALKTSGEYVGWGFQLQSPIFVAIMILALFIFALNLFGLFEFYTPGGNSLGGVQLKDSFTGDFFSGILATILSTPCSAPFLGTALTFAFTSSNWMIFLIFFFVGLGLSTPFLLTAVFPKALVILPRPGLWMDSLKKFMGLTLLLTIAWLYDVFLSLISDNYLSLILNLSLITIFFAIYFHHKLGKNKFLKIIYYVIPVLMFLQLLRHDEVPTVSNTGAKQMQLKPGNLDWIPWSEAKMNELKGELVFMDFTAKWCFTCKVNEKLVINTDDFKSLVKEKNIKLLLGDWTKRDEVIGNFLKKHGSVGVPAYFIQKRDGSLIPLGETISISKIKSNL